MRRCVGVQVPIELRFQLLEFRICLRDHPCVRGVKQGVIMEPRHRLFTSSPGAAHLRGLGVSRAHGFC